MTHSERVRALVERVLAERRARLVSSQTSSCTRIAPSVPAATPDGIGHVADSSLRETTHSAPKRGAGQRKATGPR